MLRIKKVIILVSFSPSTKQKDSIQPDMQGFQNHTKKRQKGKIEMMQNDAN